MDQIAKILQPFLLTQAQSNQKGLKERVSEQIFTPLLQSNVTQNDSSDSDSEEENLALVDGGKLSKRSRKAIKALINQKYVFPNFNILLYAQNYILPLASASATGDDPQIKEENRDTVYQLYYQALDLEPEPTKPEMTFTQIQLMNRARKFVTMRMRKRMEIRMGKRSKKDKMQMRQLLSDQLMAQLR